MNIHEMVNPILFWSLMSLGLSGLAFAYVRLARKVIKGEKV